MCASVNKVILIGNIGNDPEMRYLENGSAVAKLSLATTETYTNKHGERIDNTEWHRLELWEGLAKVAEKYAHKGSQLYVEGKIRTDEWTDKEGTKRSAITIRVNNMTLLGGTGNPKLPDNGITNSPPAQSQPKQNEPRPSDPVPTSLAYNGDEQDDLPF